MTPSMTSSFYLRLVAFTFLLGNISAFAGEQASSNGNGGDSGSTNLDGWGLAVGLGAEIYKSPYIQAASINGNDKIVSIDDERSTGISIWSVGNWTATDCEGVHGHFISKLVPCTNYVKPGFYIGVKVAGQDGTFLDGASVGIQFAFLSDQESGKSWNLGIGLVSHKTKSFAQGILEGQALPAQYDQVKYRNATETSWMVMISKGISF